MELAHERDQLEAEGHGPVVACAFLAATEVEDMDIWNKTWQSEIFS